MEGRRQVSGDVFGGSMALSAYNRDSCRQGRWYHHICKRNFITLVVYKSLLRTSITLEALKTVNCFYCENQCFDIH